MNWRKGTRTKIPLRLLRTSNIPVSDFRVQAPPIAQCFGADAICISETCGGVGSTKGWAVGLQICSEGWLGRSDGETRKTQESNSLMVALRLRTSCDA